MPEEKMVVRGGTPIVGEEISIVEIVKGMKLKDGANLDYTTPMEPIREAQACCESNHTRNAVFHDATAARCPSFLKPNYIYSLTLMHSDR